MESVKRSRRLFARELSKTHAHDFFHKNVRSYELSFLNSKQYSIYNSIYNRFKYCNILQNLFSVSICIFYFWMCGFAMVAHFLVLLHLRGTQKLCFFCSSQHCAWRGWQKFFVHVSPFVTREVCDQDRASSLVTLANVFVSFLFIVKFCVCNLNKLCVVEINSNGNDGFKQEHVESCSSAT